MDGSKPTNYDTDFLLWAKAQADAIRARDFDAIDWEHVAEEMESLGGSERRELENRLIKLMAHRLKLDHGLNREPERTWQLTVTEQQGRLNRLLRKMPSLRSEIVATISAVYTDARREALMSFEAYEPDRVKVYDEALPQDCPYTPDDLLDDQA